MNDTIEDLRVKALSIIADLFERIGENAIFGDAEELAELADAAYTVSITVNYLSTGEES